MSAPMYVAHSRNPAAVNCVRKAKLYSNTTYGLAAATLAVMLAPAALQTQGVTFERVTTIVACVLLVFVAVASVFSLLSRRTVRGYVKSGDVVKVDTFVSQGLAKLCRATGTYVTNNDLFTRQQAVNEAMDEWDTAFRLQHGRPVEDKKVVGTEA